MFRKPNLQLGRPIFVFDYEGRHGTAGCIVHKDGARHILTCRHVVLSKSGEVARGSTVKMRGYHTVEPIGIVHLAGDTTDLREDYALIKLQEAGLTLSPRLPGRIGKLSPSALSLDEIFIGMKVRKYGSVTKFTVGEISGIRLPVSSPPSTASALIEIVPFYDGNRHDEKFDLFCRTGDSGSLILSYDNPPRPIALLQKRGTGLIGRGFATHFSTIQDTLGFNIEG